MRVVVAEPLERDGQTAKRKLDRPFVQSPLKPPYVALPMRATLVPQLFEPPQRIVALYKRHVPKL